MGLRMTSTIASDMVTNRRPAAHNRDWWRSKLGKASECNSGRRFRCVSSYRRTRRNRIYCWYASASFPFFLVTLLTLQLSLERLNIKVVQDSYQNPYLLSEKEEEEALKKHAQNQKRLTIPRRPAWDNDTTPEQLKRREQESFLNWRRGLAV